MVKQKVFFPLLTTLQATNSLPQGVDCRCNKPLYGEFGCQECTDLVFNRLPQGGDTRRAAVTSEKQQKDGKKRPLGEHIHIICSSQLDAVVASSA